MIVNFLNRSRWSEPLVLSLILLGLGVWLVHADALWRWDQLIYDAHLRLWARVPSDDIVLVAVDERSLLELGRWPWRRGLHAALVDKLTAAGARVVALNIAFAEPDADDPEGDAALAKALERNGRVVLPVLPEQTRLGGQLVETLPIPALAEVAAGLGHVDVELDPDGIARSVYLKAGLGAPHWSTLALAMLQLDLPEGWRQLPGQRKTEPGQPSPYAWVRDYRILVPFAGPPGAFGRISYVDVVRGEFPPQALRGRFVLVGTTANGLADALPTPVSGLQHGMSGLEFNANVLDALHQGLIVRALDKPWQMVLTGALALLPILLYCRCPPRWTPLIAGLLLVLTLGVSLALLGTLHLWFAPAAALLVLTLSYPLWSWRQLQYTVNYLHKELLRLQTEPGIVPHTVQPPLATIMEFLRRVLPISGCVLFDPSGTVRAQWGDMPDALSRELGVGAWTRQGNGLWIRLPRRHGGWRLGLRWSGAEPPDAAQQALLMELVRRFTGRSTVTPEMTTELIRVHVRQVRDAAAQLRSMRRFIDDSLAQMADGVVVTDSLGQVLLANEQAAHLLAKDGPKQLEGLTLIEMLADTEFVGGLGWEEGVREVLLEQASVQLSAHARGGRDLLIHMAPFEVESGAVRGLVLNLADVTPLKAAERRRAERALFEEKERAQVTLHSIGDGVITTDADGIVEYLNPVAQVLTGYPADEARGRPLDTVFRVIDEQSGEPVASPVAQCLAKGHIIGLPERSVLISRSGQQFAIRASAAPIRDLDGQALGIALAVSDVTDARRMARQMAYLANHDTLTELPNRVLLRDRLRHAIAHAQRTGQRVAVLFMDLDRFKTVNDSLGHAMGDALLKAVAARLKASVREGDTVARLGGDEFVVVLEDLPHVEQVAPVARKVLEALERPFPIEGHEFFISGSIGITVFPKDGTDAETLLKNADTAMYRSKDTGRNNLQFYARDMNARALERLMLEQKLRHALARGEFELHYQPQVDLKSGRIVGVEALLRWSHPQLGRVSPGEFVPLAEETGLIIPIGEWAIRTACIQALAWQAEGLPMLRLSVNLSVRQFMQQDMTERVAHVVRETGLEVSHLELEITESLLMRDVEGAINTLSALKAMGVQLAIDDFGTGYSSLSYLKRFPIDRLKIDQSFVRDVTTNPDDAAIALAVIAMAHSMKLMVIAEGVETEAQLAFLRSRHCDEMQGYYFSRPLPAREMAALLRESQVLQPP